MDNERLNTILKMVAGLGSAGVSAISPAAGRAVLGGTNMWSNIEENDRRKKEAESEIERHNREMDIREAEHDQSKRLNDIVIAQKQSEMDAHEYVKSFGPAQRAQVDRLRGYTALGKMGADVVESDLTAGVDPFSEGAKKAYADAEIGLPFEESALAAAGAGDLGGYTRAKENLGQAKAQTRGQEEMFRRSIYTQDRSDKRQVTGIAASIAGREDSQRHSDETAEKKPKPGSVSEEDLDRANSDVSAFENHVNVKRALANAKTQEDVDKALSMIVSDPAMNALYVKWLAGKNLLEKHGTAGAPGGEKKVVSPTDVDSWIKKNSQ